MSGRKGGFRVKLHYNYPAKKWTEALPIGNGRLGAMVFGGIETEHLQLNEDTLWSGSPRDGNNPHAREVLPKVRRLLQEGEYNQADHLCREMMGPYTQSYMPLGDLHLQFDHGDHCQDYNRSLRLEDGSTRVEYRIGAVHYTREMFASHPDQLIVVRLDASQPGMLNVHAGLQSPLRHQTAYNEEHFILAGYAPENVDPNYYRTDNPIRYGDPHSTEAMRFEGRLGAVHEDGTMQVDQDGLHILGASSVTFYFSAATSFNGFDRMPGSEGKDPSLAAAQDLETAIGLPYGELRRRHVADYQSLFDRVKLHLGPAAASEDMPTDQRISKYGAQDPSLVELMFQYGRYLMIASSRPGTQPANLQGIWNKETRPPWSSNWTLNINAEMNYWPAETCNLAECHEPLLDLIGSLSHNGRNTAEIHYGARGWTAHHNTDIWCQTAPVGNYGHGDPVWALWPMGGVWLSQHVWEHFEFGRDEAFLRDKAYPIMKEAALFCLDWLIKGGSGHWITSPSTSPEHKFMTAEGKVGVSVASTGSVTHMGLVHQLFGSGRNNRNG